jgi:hypothetical protein
VAGSSAGHRQGERARSASDDAGHPAHFSDAGTPDGEGGLTHPPRATLEVTRQRLAATVSRQRGRTPARPHSDRRPVAINTSHARNGARARWRTNDPKASLTGQPSNAGIIAVIVSIVLGVAVLIIAILLVVPPVLEQQSRQRIEQAIGILTEGTALAGKPADQTPGYSVSGNILCLDDCLHASLDLPVMYGRVAAKNLRDAGWVSDTPDCLAHADREMAPCSWIGPEDHGQLSVDLVAGALHFTVGPM